MSTAIIESKTKQLAEFQSDAGFIVQLSYY